jgi:tetratricopeptide (TPR) repeat protein
MTSPSMESINCEVGEVMGVSNTDRMHDDDSPPRPSRSIEEVAKEWKDKGNLYFGQRDLKKALDAYQAGLAILTSPSSISMSDSVNLLEVALRSNRAQVFLKMNHYDRALEDCNLALDMQPQNAKGG